MKFRPDVRDELTLKFGENNDVVVKLYTDDSLSLSADGAEHFIYLYPHQVKLLKAFFDDRTPQESAHD